MKPIHTIPAMIFLAHAVNLSAAPAVSEADHATQMAADPATHQSTAKPSSGDPALSRDLAAMREKVAKLETALGSKNGAPADSTGMATPGEAPATGMAGMANPNQAAATTAGMGKMKMGGASMGGGSPDATGGGMNMMGMMDKMMGMMDKMMSMEGGALPMSGAEMAPAAPDGMGKDMDMNKLKMPGMSMEKMKMGGMDTMAMNKMKMAGMMGMPPMGGAAPDAMPQSALPGFPGTSHLYHLGATDFFLDHEAHIALTTGQTAALNQAKEKAALAKSTADRVIQQAEQELWALTASDQPDITAIEAKTAEIGKLTGESRVAFIRAVGEASKILTDEQRKILTGFAPPAPAAPMAAPTPAMAPMKDM